ncbi:helix-turn-helix domain-containing protein [Suttonella indologenes]|uniref:helix-turn-helix domain-containing protein n=1 Tax=Suttonella indologenes TaxID=13276 RepID=UPI000E1B55C3|nr:helix-turn-helix transcriptional regulator [Suttonella indologenes]
MKNATTLRTSIHSDEQIWLRRRFVQKRNELGLSQKALAEEMGVIASFIGKIETGDRRLDIFEFISYCHGLGICPSQLFAELIQRINKATKGKR